jgi:hypothetical protein
VTRALMGVGVEVRSNLKNRRTRCRRRKKKRNCYDYGKNNEEGGIRKRMRQQ